MAPVRVLRGGQATLPAEVRQKLKLTQGQLARGRAGANRVLLKTMAHVGREMALERTFTAKARVRPTPGQAKQSPDDQERALRRGEGNAARAC
jgi:bifunctional DNA-binding transcriptional regulator/antitoxin component of YhaV-PrlF toxin-antitoxin module